MTWADFVERSWRAMAEPLLALGRVEQRVYLPFLLLSLAWGSWVWVTRLRARTSLLSFLFPRAILLHPSALFDLRFMMARAWISLIVTTMGATTAVEVGIFVKSTLRPFSPFGPFGQSHGTWMLALLTMFSFVCEDLARYWTHRLSHRVPALWALHQVHHSAEVLTPFTIYRTHPIEGWLNQTASAWGLGFGAGLVAGLFHAPLSPWNLLGLHGLSVFWNLCGSNLRHSHVWVAYPAWLSRLLMSPAGHQLHHSRDQRHHDRNFASVFSLWDHLFGTYHPTMKREPLVFGLDPKEQNHQATVISALVLPVLAGARACFSRRRRSQQKDQRPDSLLTAGR